MQPTPPTQSLPERRSRTSFYLAVACLSAIAGLVLGVGGFFGVRALQGSEPAAGGATADGGSPPGGDYGGDPEVLAEAPVGPDEAVAHDVVFPYEPTSSSGRVDVWFRAVDWEATAAVLQANTVNPEPAEGSKYVIVTLEGIHRGEASFRTFAGRWITVTYVDADGTEYRHGSQVPPLFADLVEQEVAAPSDEVLAQAVFEVPEVIDGEGFFVFTPRAAPLREGVWVRAS
jgi:hypothetical protein